MYERIERFTGEHAAELHALYQDEWWSRGRGLDDVKKMIRHTDVVVAYRETSSGRLAAFARVLTDYVYKALIFDVIVAAPFRGRGLGRLLLEAIVQDQRLASVHSMELYCLPDLVPLYRKWGFTDDLGPVRFMRRAAPGKSPQPPE